MNQTRRPSDSDANRTTCVPRTANEHTRGYQPMYGPLAVGLPHPATPQVHAWSLATSCQWRRLHPSRCRRRPHVRRSRPRTTDDRRDARIAPDAPSAGIKPTIPLGDHELVAIDQYGRNESGMRGNDGTRPPVPASRRMISTVLELNEEITSSFLPSRLRSAIATAP